MEKLIEMLERKQSEIYSEDVSEEFEKGVLCAFDLAIQIVKEHKEMAFGNALYDILDEYTENDWRNEPLDGDEVDKLVEHLRNKINLINGNITDEEYEKLEN